MQSNMETPATIGFSRESKAGTITPITNSYFTLDASNTILRLKDGIGILQVSLDVVSTGIGWIDIGTMSVDSISIVQTRGIGSNDKSCSVRVSGNKIQASGGTAGTQYLRTIIPFFTE